MCKCNRGHPNFPSGKQQLWGRTWETRQGRLEIKDTADQEVRCRMFGSYTRAFPSYLLPSAGTAARKLARR